MTTNTNTNLTLNTLNSAVVDGFDGLEVVTRHRVYTYRYIDGQWTHRGNPVLNIMLAQANSDTTRWFFFGPPRR